MMQDVMLDLETMGGPPDGVVVQIGAVYFDKVHVLGREFTCNVDPRDAAWGNRGVDAGTFLWWLQQSYEVQSAVFFQECVYMEQAARYFTHFMQDAKRIWCNAPRFDFELLQQAYTKAGHKMPWHYRQERDMRTIKDLYHQKVRALPEKETLAVRASLESLLREYVPDHETMQHDALTDAKRQSVQLVHALEVLGFW